MAGDSSVTNSFLHPDTSLRTNVLGVLNILITIKKINKSIKMFNAASGQFFGNQKDNFFNENSLILPQSPYGISKATSFWFTKIFRETYDMHVCTGILFNHESPLRASEFVTKKIIDTAKLIKKRNKGYLYLGNINIDRDWGWAPEYVKAMWLMLRQKKAVDFVIGSGQSYSLRSFVYEVFRLLKIPKNRLKVNTKKLIRKNDIKSYRADSRLAKKMLKWKAKTSFKQIIYKMVNEQLF